MKKLLFFINLLAFSPYISSAIVEIKNNTKFTCEVQPVENDKDLNTMGAFKYTLKPGDSVSYNSYFSSIQAIRWRVSSYFDDNKKLARNYFLAMIPKISTFNTNAKCVINAVGKFTCEYYENKNKTNRIEVDPKHLKYIYFYSNEGWKPFKGVVGNETFDFNAEMSNDIYK